MADAIRVIIQVTTEATDTIRTPATIVATPITGRDTDIMATDITAIDIMAIALTAGHITGITAAEFITPAATAKNSGEML